jgi:hypothetical protein
MRALRAIALLLALLALAAGCVSTPHTRESGDYYSRGGSIHSDSFPPGYSPGRVPGWGSYGSSW